MDSAQQNQDTTPSIQTDVPDQPQTASPSSSKKRLFIIIGIIVVVVLTAIALLLSNSASSLTENNDQLNNNTGTPSGSFAGEQVPDAITAGGLNTLIYGAWTGVSSEIKAVNLKSNDSTTLATLPLNIKKVSVLSPQRLLYIDQTNERDHGTQIVSYQIANRQTETVVKADNGFGIDDYVLSPNKKYMATWEVSFADGSEILSGGRSRVYAIDLSNPEKKQLLYNEVADQPIHYPRAVLNDGKVFADKFLPNDPASGAGWAYGMSVVDFDGGNKQDVESMQEGTYGTQPSLSPDGKTLVFAGYDGSRGDGKSLNDGFRQALLTPNTVELLDTQTLERRVLGNLPNTNIYSNVQWETIPGSITITQLSQTEGESGLFSYNISSGTLKEIVLPEDEFSSYSFLSHLSTDTILIGKIDESNSSGGNLGEEYAASLTAVYKNDGSTEENIRLSNTLAQFITTLPDNYFQNVLGAKAYAQEANPTFTLEQENDKNNLQLQTFFMKTELPVIRERQQTEPSPEQKLTDNSCRDLATKQCLAQGFQEDTNAFDRCHDKAWDANRATKGTPDAVCKKSPLYIYGTPGQKVNIKIQTNVYNDNPKYGNGYEVTTLENGAMEVNGVVYNALNYDYRSNSRRLEKPTRGRVVPTSSVSSIINNYGTRLGLNKKEISNLVRFAKENVTSPYVFVSFYDHETSKRILPLSISPTPDNYLNVVFYFKQVSSLPDFEIKDPLFPSEPLHRSGLTVVEVSEIIE